MKHLITLRDIINIYHAGFDASMSKTDIYDNLVRVLKDIYNQTPTVEIEKWLKDEINKQTNNKNK